MNKDTLINIVLIEDIANLYDIFNGVTTDITADTIRESSVHYILSEPYVFRLAIQRLRLLHQHSVSVGDIYVSMGAVYNVLPYFIINYEDDYTSESDTDRHQFSIRNLPFFYIKFYEELKNDDVTRIELSKQIYKYSKDIIEDDVDYTTPEFIGYYLDKTNPDNS